MTFDLKKQSAEIMPLLIKLGAVEEDDFEKEWKEAESVSESFEKLISEMKNWKWKV